MPFRGQRPGSFSEDRPLGWGPVARRAIGRAMEWPDSCPKRKLPVHRPDSRTECPVPRPLYQLRPFGASYGRR